MQSRHKSYHFWCWKAFLTALQWGQRDSQHLQQHITHSPGLTALQSWACTNEIPHKRQVIVGGVEGSVGRERALQGLSGETKRTAYFTRDLWEEVEPICCESGQIKAFTVRRDTNCLLPCPNGTDKNPWLLQISKATLWHLQVWKCGLKEHRAVTLTFKEPCSIHSQVTQASPVYTGGRSSRDTYVQADSAFGFTEPTPARCAPVPPTPSCLTNLFCWRRPTRSATQGVGATEPRGPVWDSQQLRQVFLSKCAKYQSRGEARG